jgi:hypothetical protein
VDFQLADVIAKGAAGSLFPIPPGREIGSYTIYRIVMDSIKVYEELKRVERKQAEEETSRN